MLVSASLVLSGCCSSTARRCYSHRIIWPTDFLEGVVHFGKSRAEHCVASLGEPPAPVCPVALLFWRLYNCIFLTKRTWSALGELITFSLCLWLQRCADSVEPLARILLYPTWNTGLLGSMEGDKSMNIPCTRRTAVH